VVENTATGMTLILSAIASFAVAIFLFTLLQMRYLQALRMIETRLDLLLSRQSQEDSRDSTEGRQG
jgi:hypothetical protein